jgi:UDP-2,4-diacetamido-2,4,6-trideoxy-beta-L-altropyranose hydrolase
VTVDCRAGPTDTVLPPRCMRVGFNNFGIATSSNLLTAGSEGPAGTGSGTVVSVAMRVDSGTHIGGGHLARCLTLAHELTSLGAHVEFICREHPGHLIGRIEGNGYVVHRLPPPAQGVDAAHQRDAWLGATIGEDARDTLDVLSRRRVDWLVVDHYGIDAAWQKLVTPAVGRLMAIDDLANRTHEASLLLDQNYFGTATRSRYDRYLPTQSRRLLGPRYALLQPAYRQLRNSAARRSGEVRRVLVFFGMHDPTRATLKVLEALGDPTFAHLAVDVVVGSDPEILAAVRDAAHARPGITVHEQMPSLAELSAQADLAIGACGATTWERACLGLPTVVATIADNQVALANSLAAEGFTTLVGRSSSTPSSVWRLVLRRLIGDPQRVAALGTHASALTDGHGAERVARVMLGRVARVLVRPCTAADELLLLEWANDPGTRHFAFNKSRISEDEHHRWFVSRLVDKSCLILIGEDEQGLPLGQVRFDTHEDNGGATINVSVDVALRGTGVGTQLLREAIAAWRLDYPRTPIIAEVVADNEASKRLFSTAGFTVVTARRSGTITFESRPA